MRSFSLVALCIIAVALCAPARNFDFTVDSYFCGSWKVQRKELTVDQKEPAKAMGMEIYNVSMNAADSMLFEFIDQVTNEAKAEQSFSLHMEDQTTVNGVAVADKVNPFDGVNLHFQVLVENNTYVAYGCNLAGNTFEVLVDSKDHFKLSVVADEGKHLIMLEASRNLPVPTPSFFQKYGNFIMMGVMLIVNLATSKMRAPQPQAAEGEEQGEAKEGAENKEKKE